MKILFMVIFKKGVESYLNYPENFGTSIKFGE